MALSDSQLHVEASARAVLAALNLQTFDDVLAFDEGEIVKSARAHRDVVRVRAQEDVIFLKRIRGKGKEEIAHEAQVLGHLRDRNLPVPELLAWGTSQNGGVLITRALPESETLERIILHEDVSDVRRLNLAYKCADLVSALHDAGIQHRDLYAGHILVSATDDLYLVDFGRARFVNPRSFWRRRKDLGALQFSVPQRCASDRLRMRFLRRYLGSGASRRQWIQYARGAESKGRAIRHHAIKKVNRGDGNIHINE